MEERLTNLEQWAKDVETSPELRVALVQEIPLIVNEAATRPLEVYKILKYLCTISTDVQNEIRRGNVSLTVPDTGIDQFLQFLNNFAIGNEENQRIVWMTATQLTITSEKDLRLFIMLLSNLVNSDKSRGSWFLSSDEGKALFSFLLKRLEVFDDRTFEWMFFLMRGVLPNRVKEAYLECKERGQEVILLNYIDSVLLKSWETSENLFELTVLDISFLASVIQGTENTSPIFSILFSILEVSIRPLFRSPDLQRMYISSGLISFSWETLQALLSISQVESLVGLKTVLLQLLCNNLEGNREAADLAFDHLHLILSCTKIDPEHLFTREWAILIIRFLVQLVPETEARLRALEPLGVDEDTKRMRVELDPLTLRPKYKR